MADKKLRSPAFPCISLPEAIKRAFSIYQIEGTHPADSITLVRALGYSGLSGTSTSILSAIKKYDLLVRVTENDYKLSNQAIDILLNQEGNPERSQAIKQSALSPPLFRELYEEFGETLPSENNLRSRLLKRGFNAKTLDDVIRSIVDTWELLRRESQFLSLSAPAAIEKSNTPVERAEIPEKIKQSVYAYPSAASQHPDEDGTTLIFRISKESEVRISFDGTPTQEAIDKLIALLQLSKDTYPTAAELLNKKAIWRSGEGDIPINVRSELGVRDGIKYFAIEGSNTGIPETEIEFESA